MKELIKNKKIQNIIIATILLSVVLSAVAAPVAMALAPTTDTTKSLSDTAAQTAKSSAEANGYKPGAVSTAFLWVFNTILTAILTLTSRFMGIAGAFFDIAIEYNFHSLGNSKAVQIGWTISRDVANVFFILILLIIAIATILRVGSYNAKALLPKLIVIALLINFSLVFSYFIVDFTNVIGKGFYDKLTEQGDIAAVLMKETAINKIFNVNPNDPSSANNSSSFTRGYSPTAGNPLTWITGGAATGLAALGLCTLATGGGCLVGAGFAAMLGAFGGAGAWLNWSGLSFDSGMQYFYIIAMANILTIPLTFVFLFGGILLFIRAAILSIILVLAPIAFISYILPVTESKVWSKWWDTFLNHAFFLPAFMFLLYLSLTMINEWALWLQTTSPQANPQFIAFTFMACVLLIASLIIARSMGIYFAGNVIGWAVSGRKWLVGFAGRNTIARLGEGIAKTGIGERITAASPFFGTYANRGVDWLRKRGGADKFAQEQAALGMKLSDSQRTGYFAKLNLAGKEALLRQMQPEEREKFINNLSSSQQKLARGITGSALFPAGERKAMDMAQFKSLPPQQQRDNFGALNEDARSEYLKTLSADDKAKFVSQLSTDPKASAKALLESSRFSQKEQQDYRIAEVMLGNEEAQSKAFVAMASDNDREALLRKKDAKQQAKFVDGFNKPAPAGVSAADWTDAKTSAESMIHSARFTTGEQKAYREAEIENIGQKNIRDIETAASTMTDDELGTLTSKISDAEKTGELITTMADREKARAMGKYFRDHGLENKYRPYVTPQVFVEDIKGHARGSTDYENGMKEYFAGIDAKALRSIASSDTIKQPRFVEDLIKYGSMKNLADISSDPVRSVALKDALDTFVPTTGKSREEELMDFLNKPGKTQNTLLAQQIKDQVATSAGKSMVARILQGKPPPLKSEGDSGGKGGGPAAPKPPGFGYNPPGGGGGNTPPPPAPPAAPPKPPPAPAAPPEPTLDERVAREYAEASRTHREPALWARDARLKKEEENK